jgi:hypothetical protein
MVEIGCVRCGITLGDGDEDRYCRDCARARDEAEEGE